VPKLIQEQAFAVKNLDIVKKKKRISHTLEEHYIPMRIIDAMSR
jgi:hypothetical protein